MMCNAIIRMGLGPLFLVQYCPYILIFIRQQGSNTKQEALLPRRAQRVRRALRC